MCLRLEFVELVFLLLDPVVAMCARRVKSKNAITAVRSVRNLSDGVAIPHSIWEIGSTRTPRTPARRWCIEVMPDSGERFLLDIDRLPYRALAIGIFV